MNQSEILNYVLESYKLCSVNSFPINCFEVLDNCKIEYTKYSEQSKKKQTNCLLISEEAFILKGKIYYNDLKIKTRVRFSLMHELGHIMMDHSNNRTPLEEYEADVFASNFLAPRIAIHYSKCKNAVDVMKNFGLSEKAAIIAFDDYRRWHRDVTIRGMAPIDRAMYNYFYNPDIDKFVWKVHKCDYCYTEFSYNGEHLCNTCRLFEIRKKYKSNVIFDQREHSLDILRGNRLYQSL